MAAFIPCTCTWGLEVHQPDFRSESEMGPQNPGSPKCSESSLFNFVTRYLDQSRGGLLIQVFIKASLKMVICALRTGQAGQRHLSQVPPNRLEVAVAQSHPQSLVPSGAMGLHWAGCRPDPCRHAELFPKVC